MVGIGIVVRRFSVGIFIFLNKLAALLESHEKGLKLKFLNRR